MRGAVEMDFTGMVRLRLQFPPTVAHMADHAAVAVAAAAHVDGIELDFGVASLAFVDKALGRFHDEGLDPEQVAETIFCFGAYIGQVMVRAAGGSWVTVGADHPLGDAWPLVELPRGNLANPLGKAFKRVANGEVESIPYFYKVSLGPDAADAAGASPRRPDPS